MNGRSGGELAAGNPQKAAVLLHCEEQIYSRVTDDSSLVVTCAAEWLKKRKEKRTQGHC